MSISQRIIESAMNIVYVNNLAGIESDSWAFASRQCDFSSGTLVYPTQTDVYSGDWFNLICTHVNDKNT